jgi:methylglutaconyl-CoA hydratase
MPSITVATDSRGVARVTLTRAQKHNALDAATIAELHAALQSVANDSTARAMVLTGDGASFCAGADIAHMKSMLNASEQSNYEDALSLAQCLQALDEMPMPTIARVNGNAFGGGLGLIACADIAIGVSTARFALTEVRLGIVPATISPYVVAAIGPRQARRLFVSATAFDAHEAESIDLLHSVVEPDALDTAVESQLTLLLQVGPKAAAAAKQLVRTVLQADDRAALNVETAKLLASLRASAEGQEGLGAFLEKRRPSWLVARG